MDTDQMQLGSKHYLLYFIHKGIPAKNTLISFETLHLIYIFISRYVPISVKHVTNITKG